MYSNSSKELLEARLGFGSDLTITPDVATSYEVGTSGRTTPAFHKLADLHNIFHTVDKSNMSKVELESHLDQLRKDAVNQVLTAVLNKNESYQSSFDYSDTIAINPELFDDAIGYTLAIMIIEQIMTTSRSNDDERIAKLSYNQLKIELDGLTDNSGRVVSKGIRREKFHAIKNAAKVIFPKKIGIFSPKFW